VLREAEHGSQGEPGNNNYFRRPDEIINNFESAPLIHIDGAQGLLAAQGVVMINLFQLVQDLDKTDPSDCIKKLVVARLSMSREVARNLVIWLSAHVMDKSDTASQTLSSKLPDDK
jgi:hypothetical protein